MDKNRRLVWSDDPKDKASLEAPETRTEEKAKPGWTAVFRLEKNGRGGKTVTVIDQLPRQESFLSELCKELKSKCGAGGKYGFSERGGLIEIQGDKRQQIKAIFEAKGIRYKGM